jgi:hypothetical protein
MGAISIAMNAYGSFITVIKVFNSAIVWSLGVTIITLGVVGMILPKSLLLKNCLPPTCGVAKL